jgi:hypothetical protein
VHFVSLSFASIPSNSDLIKLNHVRQPSFCKEHIVGHHIERIRRSMKTSVRIICTFVDIYYH